MSRLEALSELNPFIAGPTAVTERVFEGRGGRTSLDGAAAGEGDAAAEAEAGDGGDGGAGAGGGTGGVAGSVLADLLGSAAAAAGGAGAGAGGVTSVRRATAEEDFAAMLAAGKEWVGDAWLGRRVCGSAEAGWPGRQHPSASAALRIKALARWYPLPNGPTCLSSPCRFFVPTSSLQTSSFPHFLTLASLYRRRLTQAGGPGGVSAGRAGGGAGGVITRRHAVRQGPAGVQVQGLRRSTQSG